MKLQDYISKSPYLRGVIFVSFSRLNAIRLEEKEKREKEIVREIIEEAEQYKAEYYRKWKLRCENNIAANREKEKVRPISIIIEVFLSHFA